MLVYDKYFIFSTGVLFGILLLALVVPKYSLKDLTADFQSHLNTYQQIHLWHLNEVI